jgi:hypothetical protein
MNFGNPDEVLELEVSGVTEGFKVSKSLLTSIDGTKLKETFSGDLKKFDGKVFIDRDPNMFKHLINFLRIGGEDFPAIQNPREEQMFEFELEYWGIKKELLIKTLNKMFSKEPEILEGDCLKKWQELERLEVRKLIE